jgi:hypothetical protein
MLKEKKMKYSLDALVYFIFIFFNVVYNLFGWGIVGDRRVNVILVLLGIVYLLIELFSGNKKNGVGFWIKFTLALFSILIIGVGQTISLMKLRQVHSIVGFINDSALQTEIAGRFILLGKNPYKEPYADTDLAKWVYADEQGNKINPALFSNVIPPFMLLLSAFGFRIFSQLFGWFDMRVFILGFYILLIFLGYFKFKKTSNLLLFLMLTCLNPLFVNNMAYGTNDVVVLFFLLASILFLEKKEYFLSGLFSGLGFATKQTFWFMLPFIFVYIFYSDKKGFKKFFLSFLIVASAFYLPFLFWDFSALIRSLVFYVGGSQSYQAPIHPIEGLSFGRFLVGVGKLPSIYSSYPFWMYQLVLGTIFLIVIFFLFKKQIKNLNFIFFAYTCFLSVIWFFNRYFLESHLAFISVLVGVSYVWPQRKN